MKTHLILLALVGLACASTSPAWKDNTEYVYLVNGRTFTSLHELSNQYSGILLRARLRIISLPNGNLQGRIPIAEYAQIHSQLTDGWNTNIPESEMTYKPLDLSNKPFQIIMKNGLIKGLIMEKDMTNWQANIIKSIVSQFQLDVKGSKLIPSPINNLPKEDRFDGVFKTMEETVTGETETSYDIHPLPDYLMQKEPWLVPQPNVKGDGSIVEIIKNKNFTNSDERPIYHYGFGDILEGHPSYNRMGKFYNRQSNSRVVLTGKLSKFTIQHSRTINKIIINPTLNSKEQGSVISIVNVTLHEVKSQSDQPQALLHPVEIGNIVYTYEAPFSSNLVHKKRLEQSDSSESSEEDSNESWQRVSRGAINKLRQESDELNVNLKDKNQYQSTPLMKNPPEFPLLPYYMGYYGSSIKANKDLDLKQNVKRIAQEISEDVQQPEKILTHSTLSKYVMLSSLTRLMNEEEIRLVAEDLYTKSKQGQERVTWVAFRDAVADAGTGPAFLNIQEWIESRKIEKDEAAEVVAAMSGAVRVPTKEYMRKFFDLVKKPIVNSQENLNETSLLVYTSLVHKVYVNRNQSRNEFPVHTFKDVYTQEGRKFINNTVIPYFTKQLHNAVSVADSRKIHIYIRALGNIGNREVLKAFEPYLEGDKQASQFQRMLMVLSMDKLVESDPTVAASVLYKIYQNTAELPELRVVAVHQLMKSNPPEEMIQRMAENTNIDPQEQVNAAVKTVIESASELKSEESQQLRKAAEIAKPLLTKKEYGKHLSLNLLQEFIVENMDVELQHNFLQIGSSDYNLPKGIKYGMHGNVNGMRNYRLKVDTVLSSVKQLLNVVYKQSEHYQQSYQTFQQNYGDSSEWSSPKIAELLNLQTNEREQLEGFIYGQIEHIHQMWSFDNATVSLLPKFVRDQEELLKTGTPFSYVKIRQLKELVLSLPTEMGLPFLYTYDQPMFVQFEGKVKAVATPAISRNNKLSVPDQFNAEVDGHITLSAKIQSHLKVVTPFDHQIYVAGFDKNVQAHVPLKVKVDMDLKNHQIQMKYDVEEPHKNARLLHYSSWPYTSRSDIMSFDPISLSPTTYLIKPQDKNHRSFDFVIGQKNTGLSFRVWGHHPQQSKDLFEFMKLFKTADISTIWQLIWDEASMHQTEFSIAFIPEQSSTKTVIVRLGHTGKYQKVPEIQNEQQYCSVEELSRKLKQEPKLRQQDMLKCVGAEIPNAKLNAFDASVEFQGDQTYQHILALAFGKSNVAPQSRLVAFYKVLSRRPLEFALKAKAFIPNTDALDLTYSLKNKPVANYEILFQEKQWDQDTTKIMAVLNLTRSNERKRFIERQPLYEVCKKQMQEGNRQLPACQNLTIESNFFDDIKIQLEHENIRREWSSNMGSLFKSLRLYYYPITEVNSIQSDDDRKVTLRVRFQPEDLRKVNITVRLENEETTLYNLSISDTTKALVVSHPMYHLPLRVQGKLMGQDNIRPTCVIDEKAAQTLSNITYPISLGQEWTVLMQYVPQQARLAGQPRQSVVEQLKDQNENLAVLVRETSNKKREVKIVLNNPETQSKNVELTMKPKQGSKPLVAVVVEGKEVELSEQKAAELFNGYVEIYALPSGEVKLEIQNWFHIIFDGNRVKLTATSDKLRDSIVGLCGRFNEDKYEDLWTPRNCIVRSYEKFVKSYVLNGKQQQDDQQEYQQRSSECIAKVLPLYADVISDSDVNREVVFGDYSSPSGIRLRNRYVEENGDICFTLHPVPVCENLARTSITKDVPVHCITKTKTAYYLKNQIDQGGNPDFSNKSATKTVQMEIPKNCY